jgi:hypothetical protein
MPPHAHTDFVVPLPGCDRSVTDFWGWGAHRARLHCHDDVSDDMYERGVPGEALNLNSTGYPDNGRYGDLTLQGKISTSERGIEPGTSWLVVRSAEHQTTRLVIMKFMLLGNVFGEVTSLRVRLWSNLGLNLGRIWDFLVQNSFRSDVRGTKPNYAAGYFVKISVSGTWSWHITSFECWDQECVELCLYLRYALCCFASYNTGKLLLLPVLRCSVA